jgi:MOSC domain-containing protein YiiM
VNWKGAIEAIHVAAREGDLPGPVAEARAVAGRGLEGDRYFAASAAEDFRAWNQVTFIESEALEALERDYGLRLAPAECRRNILTRGVPLNHLVGQEFRVGAVRFLGRELCEPCGYLEKKTRKGVIKGLIHRGGLRAEILTGGTLRTGDAIEPA